MIGFDLLSSNEIIDSSTFGSHESTRGSKSLYDPRLGLPNNEDKCGTCQMMSNKEHLCPGHFGHFCLALPIFNPQHIRILVRILNLICPGCGNRKDNQRKKGKQDSKEGGCKHCNAEGAYPELRFRVVTRKMQDFDIDTIEMHAVSKKASQFPADFWSFVDRSMDVIDSPRLSRPLLPAEAIRMLNNVPDEVLRRIGFTLRPTCLIIHSFLIPPNCLRLMDGFKDGHSLRRLELNQKTRSLSSILSMNKSLKKEYDDFNIAYKDTMELQARFAAYYKSFKIFSSEKDPRLHKRKAPKRETYHQTAQKSGQTWFKMNILGKRSHYSSLGVLSAAPHMTLQQLAIPRIVAQNLMVNEGITSHNVQRFQKCIRDCPSKYFVTRNNEKWRMSCGQRPLDLQVGDVIERPLMNGDLVFSNRLPSLHKHSFIGFRAKIEERYSFGINPILCGPISGDFDGDLLHVYAPQSLEARAEVTELLDVSQQMISSQGGQALLKLSQDGILSSYLILQRHFWLSKHEIHMLNMYCCSPVPRPAIIKAPGARASLWTGLQVLSMTLPPHVDYTYATSVFVHDSEFLECTVENKWLMDSQHGIVASLCHSQGNQKALEFLTMLQNVLHEWMFQVGFSVGLKDMYLTDDFPSRKKLLTEIQIALEDAKLSSKRALDLERQIEFVVSGKGEIGPDGFTSAGDTDVFDFVCEEKLLSPVITKSAEGAATREFQGVFGEIQTTVERHSSPFNSMLAMVKAGSKGSFSNLVQQCACLGLQLSHGERWLSSKEIVYEDFCEYPGIVGTCFVDGLNSSEFVSHLISSRKPGKGFGAEGPGELFRKCMFGLRELYLAYDGSVRTRSDNHVIQLLYEGLEDDNEDSKHKLMSSQTLSVGSEAVGTLAVTAVIEPAYNYTFDQSKLAKTNPIELLKETLLRGTCTRLKEADFKSILAISSSTMKRETDLARAAWQIQDYLQHFTLEMVPLKTMIEYDLQRRALPWVIHIHMSQIAIKRVNVKVPDIISIFSQSHAEEECDKIISSDCPSCEKNEVCINVSFNLNKDPREEEESSFGNDFLDQLNLIKHSVLPLLLKTAIKGSLKIKSASIHWKDFEHWPTLFDKERLPTTEEDQLLGELFVEVSTSCMPQRGQAWEVVKESCNKIFDCIDWRRSRPYSISEVYVSLGIEAARAVIYEKLQQCTHELGRKVGTQHLSLISDYMTHSGQVLPFNASGLKLWNKVMDISAPFTEGAFQNPRGTYFDAARRRKTERLSGMLSSLIWGKCDTSESAFFDLLWSPKSQHQSSFQDNFEEEGRPSYVGGNDVLDFLSHVSQVELSERMRTNPNPKKFEREDIIQNNEETAERFPEYPPGFEHHNSCETERDKTENRSQLTLSIRRILHHRYNDGEELSDEDMNFLIQNVLIHHPNSKAKTGCGISAIKIGQSLEHPESRCFILCRNDGTFEDFSYHKCLLNMP
ncbi:hypothetical protein GOP47_0019674 [Adiantum capillus-veneris]|uniref:DNA-directed RNA polymerase subunit n=1 Tax=Adiantum capillus-veneris TaxID=13818 RepID=A0A9D4UCZ8_ADICA|nr:hypothetical protein GOP47_0019674 [Adiantum capillus-veneris]